MRGINYRLPSFEGPCKRRSVLKEAERSLLTLERFSRGVEVYIHYSYEYCVSLKLVKFSYTFRVLNLARNTAVLNFSVNRHFNQLTRPAFQLHNVGKSSSTCSKKLRTNTVAQTFPFLSLANNVFRQHFFLPKLRT